LHPKNQLTRLIHLGKRENEVARRHSHIFARCAWDMTLRLLFATRFMNEVALRLQD